MKRRIITMLLVLVMVLSMATAVSAAGTDGSAALGLKLTKADGEAVVTVTLQGCEGVTNGRFSVDYDADVLTLVGVEVSDAYAMSSVNDETAGTVWLAWVGSDLTAERTLMLTLYFTAAEDTVTVSAESDGIYADTELVDVAGASLTGSLTDAVDTTELEKAIAKAEELDEERYTEKSWSAVEKALENAKAVLADPDATQEEVDAAAKALNDAMAALKLLGGDDTDTGDDAMLALPVMLAVICLLGIAALTVMNKRRNRA